MPEKLHAFRNLDTGEEFVGEILNRVKSAGEYYLSVQRYEIEWSKNTLTKLRNSPKIAEIDYIIMETEMPDNPVMIFP